MEKNACDNFSECYRMFPMSSFGPKQLSKIERYSIYSASDNENCLKSSQLKVLVRSLIPSSSNTGA